MKILITGICGFVGSAIARSLAGRMEGVEIFGVDNLSRPGAEMNRARLRAAGIRVTHADLRAASDLETLPDAEWVIDAAANPSVLAGVDGRSTTRQLVEHNLWGTINILEYCRRVKAGMILLSSSRVYSIPPLAGLPMKDGANRYELDDSRPLPEGVSRLGIAERFATLAPVSLYGATKLASEVMAMEYAASFELPVWINRCGVLAGAGQFGTAEQGIFSYWLHAHAARRPLRYIGFNGRGWQVRDAFHPEDLAGLIVKQMRRGKPAGNPIYNAGGGPGGSMSLAELTAWCDERFGAFAPAADLRPRPFDLPWLVMDNSRVTAELDWRPEKSLGRILDEIGEHVRQNPGWLEACGV